MNNFKILKLIALVSICVISPLSFAKTSTVAKTVQDAVASVDLAASDTTITGKIKGLYASEKIFGDKDISLLGVKVETRNSIVLLTGHVTTEDQATNAVKIARSVKGVSKVVYNFKIG